MRHAFVSIKSIVAGVAWVLASALATAADKATMTWLVLDLPPASIIVDGKPTEGITDVVVKLLIQEWPEVDHWIMVANTARGMTYRAQDEFFRQRTKPTEASKFESWLPGR